MHAHSGKRASDGDVWHRENLLPSRRLLKRKEDPRRLYWCPKVVDSESLQEVDDPGEQKYLVGLLGKKRYGKHQG